MKKTINFLIALFLLSLVFFPVEASNDLPKGVNGWKAGVAKVAITPEGPMWLAGYASRNHPSEGILHDLWAKALAFEDSSGNRAVLITTDVLGFPKGISDTIRNRLQQEYNLSRSQVILNSSHTHSGPVLSESIVDIYSMGSSNWEKAGQYSAWLEDQIVKLVGKALNSLEPVKLYSGNGVTRFQVNRRNNKEKILSGLTELKGPNDYAVPVLKVANLKGELLAVAFGYACHATVLNGYEWSGDYPGFAQIELEKSHPGTTAMFFQGAGADINPLPRRSVPLAQQYGGELACAVERVLNEEMKPLPPTLSTAYSEVELQLEAPPSEEELSQMANNSSGYKQRWAKRFLDKAKRGEPIIKSYPYPLQIWKLGGQLMVSLGGELTIEYAIKLKQVFGQDIFVLGYSNDVMAYIPSVKVLIEGGYEGATSQMVYGLPSKWKPTIESMILDEVVNLAGQAGITPLEKPVTDSILIAKRYFSGFDKAHDTYNAISSASDGNIYYVLSSSTKDKAGQMYAYYPDSDKTKWIADLNGICGEKEAKAIAQGKSHVNFYERNGKLYFATHVGFYEMIDGAECMPVTPQEGYKLYPGGHIVSYDLSTGVFEDLDIAPDGEGIITMSIDTERGQIYGITWPKGYFVHYDIEKDTLKNLGLISGLGEAGTPGEDYRVLCRSMFVDQRDGAVYYSTSEGDIFTYSPSFPVLKKVEGVNLKLDYFGKYDPTRPGNMGYNWRRIIWYPQDGVAYGVHGNSGYLFRFDPRGPKIEIVDRITSEQSKRSGMFDQFSYGYLGFKLGPDKQTLYYLTGGPIYIDGKRVKGVDEINMGAAKGLENLHLITYNIPKGEYRDHGPVFYEDGKRPTYVNSIAIGANGDVYTLARFEQDGKIIEDLVKIPNPFSIE